MIIKGRTHNNAQNLATYLQRLKPDEAEFVMQLRDAATNDLREALTDWELCGRSISSGEQILFHSHIRLRDYESMTESQWMTVVERLENKLGLTNCPRAIVGHNDANRGLHIHAVWSRLSSDPEATTLAPLHFSDRRCYDVSRWAEKEFGMEPVVSPKERRPGNAKSRDKEIKAIKDRGGDREQAKKVLLAAWNASNSGQEFTELASRFGYPILKGTRRDYVVSIEGVKVNPVRLLDGVTAAAFRERMKDAAPVPESAPTEGQSLRRRRAQSLTSDQARHLSNDNEKAAQEPPRRPDRTMDGPEL